MSEQREVIRHRLSALTVAQRALLVRRLKEGKSNGETTGAGQPSIPKEPPRRVDVDAEGRQVAVYPASHGQQWMWFMHHYMPDSPVYNTPTAFQLRGSIDVKVLEAAFHHVIKRHENLRTTFAMEEGELVQRVASSSAFRLEHVSSAQAPTEDRKKAANHRIEKSACLPFDLAVAPPFRVMLVSIEHDEHLFLVVMHHIISDGWSRSNLYRELSIIYSALATGAPVTLPELSVQYADYSAWQRRRLENGVFEEQAAYWKSKLADEPERLNIPGDRFHPAEKSFRGGECSLEIDHELVSALKARAQEGNATLFMILLAAFKALLHRYTGQTDVLVGVPIANRQRPEVEGLIGLFINTLVLRTAVSGDATFAELLGRVKETALEAYEHQDMPFDLLIRLLQVRRDSNKKSLFQTIFTLQDFPEIDLSLAGLEITPFPVSTLTSKVDLTLEIRPVSNGLRAILEFNSELFSPDLARQILQHWRAVLQDIVFNPARRLSEISMLSPPEKHRVLVEWNRTERDYPRDKCVVELFEGQAERTPDAVAVECEAQSLTYGELNVRAGRLARHLRSFGVRQEEKVVILLERSLDVPVAVMGVVMAGGAFVPLVPELPQERIDFILRDTKARVLLTQRKFLSRLSATEAEVICLDERKSDHLTDGGFTETSPIASPQDLAYVIYTSGSTGEPKGVQVTRGAIALHCLGMIDLYRLNPTDRMLHFAAMGFDAAIEDLLTPLLAGARVVMRGQDLWDPTTLTQRILESGITVIELTPLYWQYWLASLDPESVADSLGSLRLVSIGGDVMPVAGVQRWSELGLDKVRLINMYGPTEATISALALEVDASWTKSPTVERIPIGRPLANRCAYILDQKDRPVAICVTGELYLGGEGIARGYLNRPKLTAERFLPDPFSNKPGARLYKTGDLARYLPDGNIEFLGRVDHQVKIRGFRIELGEIEEALNRHPGVQTSVVLAREDTPGDKRLVAYWVGNNGAASSSALREYLLAKLPDYIVPAAFVRLKSLPLTPNGKVDRKALPQPDFEAGVDKSKWVAPSTPIEVVLGGIWCEVLGLKQVGIHDNFFELGGHSLKAVHMRLRIASLLHVDVPLRWLFEHPTIEGLAKQLECSSGDLQTVQALEKVDRRKPLAMSFAQQQMWLLHQMVPDQATYNLPVAWHISGRVDREKVRRALQLILERHEVLRTSLVQQGESLLQEIASVQEAPLSWKELDLQGVPPTQKQTALEDLLREEARRPFDLARVPLWRVVWIELEADEHLLAVTFHHGIGDEWSLRMLFRELEEIYATDGRVQNANVPELPIQYADYSAWQRRQLSGTLLEQLRHYWREQLRDLPSVVELPADLPQPAQFGGQGATHEFRLTEPVVSGFRALAGQERTTLFTVMLAAFQVWMHRYTGQTDLVVGTPIANRERPEAKALLGYFLNTLPIRTRLDENHSFIEVVRQVRKTVLEAFGHAKLPFEQIVELAVKERNPGQQPLYQVMFVLLEEGIGPLRLGQAQSRFLPMETGTCKNDLTLNIRAENQSWACRLQYATELFSSARVDGMARHLTELFRSITENPQKPISQLNLLPEAERQQILVEWNRTERDFPRDKCLHELFEEQAEKTPEAVALVFGNRQLTYSELNAQANQLARHLRKLGVGPDTLVGICAERSLEMVIGLMGILKAGGAYVPLDPECPRERLAFMMDDAAVTVLLTQAALVETLPACAARLIRLDADWPVIANESETNVETATTGEHLAYMIYTSGSTGRPKGAMNTHEGIVNRLQWMQDAYQLTPADRVLQKTPFSFDVSVWEFFWPLLTGASLVVARPGGHRDGAYLAQLIAQEKITTLHFVPSMLQVFLEQEDLNASCSSLKRVICSGEALPIGLQRRFFSTLGAELHNLYGPTEASVDVTYWACDRNSPLNTVPIGRPIANIQVYILDGQFQPVPVGVAGELHLGGVGLARGYHNRPELTAEKFIANPFSADPQARLYKTGDLARYLPDGNIEFLGRVDHQVKIRGFRIELGEIEEVLNRHPGVQTSVVVVREDTPGDKRLVAYWVGNNGAASASELRKYLLAKLPDYMAPAAFVALESLPLTPNGKMDRKALPQPDFEAGADKGKFVAPGTPTERVLAGIWCEVLGLKQVGIHDNFFELGGNSILAVRLINKISKSLLVHLPIPMFFQNPTIKKLETVVDQENHDKHEPRLLHHRESIAPFVTFQAKGDRPPLFFLHGDWTGGGFYCGTLSQLLGEDQPFHALTPYRSEKQTAVTMEEMATYHLAAIQEHTPQGPYLLGGYCIGATVAVEIARQLIEKGEKVTHLLLISPSHVCNRWLYRFWPVVDGIGEILKWDLQKKIHCFDLTAVALTRWLKEPPGSKFTSLRRRLGLTGSNSSSAKAAGPEQHDGGEESLDSLEFSIYVLADRTYIIKPISVPTTAYFPEETPVARQERNRAPEIFSMLTFETVPGDHRSCISRHTPALAEKMKKTLDVLSRLST